MLIHVILLIWYKFLKANTICNKEKNEVFTFFCKNTSFVFNTMCTSRLLCCFTNCYSTQLLCSFDPNPRRKDCSRKTYLFPTCEFKRKSVQKDLEKRFVEATTFNRLILLTFLLFFLVFYLCLFFKTNNIVCLLHFYFCESFAFLSISNVVFWKTCCIFVGGGF